MAIDKSRERNEGGIVLEVGGRLEVMSCSWLDGIWGRFYDLLIERAISMGKARHNLWHNFQSAPSKVRVRGPKGSIPANTEPNSSSTEARAWGSESLRQLEPRGAPSSSKTGLQVQRLKPTSSRQAQSRRAQLKPNSSLDLMNRGQLCLCHNIQSNPHRKLPKWICFSVRKLFNDNTKI